MIIKEIMSPAVDTVTKDDDIFKTALIMKNRNVGAVPVMDGGQVCGIVTDRDIVLRCIASDKDIDECKVSDIMTGDTTTAESNWTVNEALKVMSQKQIRRLPVTENGKLTGMISIGDIARQRRSAEVAGALSEISMP